MFSLFHSENKKRIEQLSINVLSKATFAAEQQQSTRGIGDYMQSLLSEQIPDSISDLLSESSKEFERRSMADFALKDKNNNHYIVDVKTHRVDTKFNMPNLTSVERLTKFYRDSQNIFAVLFITYSLENSIIKINKVDFFPIEWLDWSCLTIGALGWGQIQIRNSNNTQINSSQNRKQWMIHLCETMLDFYHEEIEKITQTRVNRFQQELEFWEKQ